MKAALISSESVRRDNASGLAQSLTNQKCGIRSSGNASGLSHPARLRREAHS